MRDKRMVFILLSLFCGAVPLWAQFDAVCAQLSSRPYTKGVFEQTRITRRQKPLVSGGDFLVVADAGMVWITKSPTPSTTTLGRDYMIQSVPGGTSTRIDAKGNDMYINMADTMSSLFTGNAERLKSNFDHSYTETRTANGKNWIISLVPRDRAFRNFAQQIILEGFDGGQGAVIRSIAIHEKNGNSLTYAFSGQSFPATLEAHEKAYFPDL